MTLEQLTFPDPPAQRHSRTSRQAAERIKDHAPSIRERVYEVIRREGPISDQRLASTLGLAENSIRPRRVELVAEGLVRAHYETVLTASNRQATAWVLSEPS